MGFSNATNKASSLRPRSADTVEVTFSGDKLPSESALASSTPPCVVTESTALVLKKVLFVTFTPLALSCGISVISAELLLSERRNVTVPVPLSSARRRLETSVAVQLGEMTWHAFTSFSTVSSASSPPTSKLISHFCVTLTTMLASTLSGRPCTESTNCPTVMPFGDGPTVTSSTSTTTSNVNCFGGNGGGGDGDGGEGLGGGGDGDGGDGLGGGGEGGGGEGGSGGGGGDAGDRARRTPVPPA